jgi:hypothetical protein
MDIHDVYKQVKTARNHCEANAGINDQYEAMRTAMNNLAALLVIHDPELYADLAEELPGATPCPA